MEELEQHLASAEAEAIRRQAPWVQAVRLLAARLAAAEAALDLLAAKLATLEVAPAAEAVPAVAEATPQDGYKTCPRCGATKPVHAFYRRKLSRDGRTVYCALCMREYSAAWRERQRQRHGTPAKRDHGGKRRRETVVEAGVGLRQGRLVA